MNFPHLRDTQFPNIATVDVYQYQNNFDYTRWSEDTRIKLVNVIWNSDYKDVVKFPSNTARDYYFDNIEDYYALELSQAARIVPDNYVKLPIPYDVMARYNYLFIDLPIATSADAPIDYENSAGLRRWYFFIESISYLSPNSTQVFLSLDVWTNYQNEVEINYMMLERGHAPVHATDTDIYLANPIDNAQYLLAPDVNYDNAAITRSSSFVPFGNGAKYVCIASVCSPEQIEDLGSVTPNSNYDPFGTITYSDVNARYGYQLQVNGLSIGAGLDFSDATTPVKTGGTSDGLLPNNLTIYAIPATECYDDGTFFGDVQLKCPQFLNTVRACFVVDGACLTFDGSCRIANHTLQICKGVARNLLTKQLQKQDFNYPTRYERFAKLYTSPYAELEITDNDGTSYTVNIEETSTLEVKSVVAVAYPYIDYRVYVDGIGGVGSRSYTWMDLNGNTDTLSMSNSDWFKFCFDWQIPTFALYMSGETAYQLSNFNRSISMGINNALVNYHNTMRSANTAKENADDSADTAHSNVYDSTDTAKANAYRSAATGETNAKNLAATNNTNTTDSANADYANVYDSMETLRDNVDEAIASNIEVEEFGIAGSGDIVRETNNGAYLNVSSANTANTTTTNTQTHTTTATTENSGINQMLSGSVGGVLGGASFGMAVGAAGGPFGAAGGAALGAAIGFAGGGISAITANSNASIVTQANAATQAVVNQMNSDITARNAVTAERNFGSDYSVRRSVYISKNDLLDTQTDNNIDLNLGNATKTGNAVRTRDTIIANAGRTKTTLDTNAENTRDTSEDNADDVWTCDRGNADRTQTTTKDNAGYTREVEELNAKELLENSCNASMAALLDARNAVPVEIGETSGNPTADYMRTRGIQIKVKTQSESAIQQTGDYFARYGYALNQIWNVRNSGLCLMNYFTYWKASDIWVDDRESSNNSVQNFFTKIFLDGVTVWSDPTRIGKVSIYDN